MNIQSNEGIRRILWVEAGRRIPEYAKRNFKLTKKLFPEVRQTLITDQLRKSQAADFCHISSFDQSSLTRHFLELEREWKFKQVDFWQGTTLRFFYLYDYLISRREKFVLHLESDCILLDLDSFKGQIPLQDYGLSYPLQAKGIGCASIMYIRSHSDLRDFLEYVISRWEDNDCDDMVLLGEFAESGGAKSLPTWIEQGGKEDVFYDAGSVGVFYLGKDARNNKVPFSSRGSFDSRAGSISNYFLDPDLLWRVEKKRNPITVKAEYKGSVGKLANIHVHSKRIPRSPRALHRMLRREMKSKKSWIWSLGTFDHRVFLERAYSFSCRRFLMRKTETERSFR